MKLPCWIVVTLLSVSVLVVIGAGAWWWVTWPERTAREFYLELCDERMDTLEMLRGNRTVFDVILARQTFAICRNDGKVVIGLKVERGGILANSW